MKPNGKKGASIIGLLARLLTLGVVLTTPFALLSTSAKYASATTGTAAGEIARWNPVFSTPTTGDQIDLRSGSSATRTFSILTRGASGAAETISL